MLSMEPSGRSFENGIHTHFEAATDSIPRDMKRTSGRCSCILRYGVLQKCLDLPYGGYELSLGLMMLLPVLNPKVKGKISLKTCTTKE